MKKVLILGAGITGLAAARELSLSGFDVTVLEASDRPGGLAGSYKDNDGFMYDKGPHYFFSTLARKIGIEEKCKTVPYYESICVDGRYYRFPFGLMTDPRLFLSVALAFVKRTVRRRSHWDDLRGLLEDNYGKHFTAKILSPLIEKWSGVKSDEISSDFGLRLLPGDIRFVVYSIFTRLKGYTEDYFNKGRYMVYPEGGMGILFDKLISDGKLKIEYNAKVERIDSSGNAIRSLTAGGREYTAGYYLSTIPVDDLAAINPQGLLGPRLSSFRYRSIVVLFLKVKRGRLLDRLWYWYPEGKTPFYRISEQYGSDREKRNRSVLCLEFGCERNGDLYRSRDEEIFKLGLRHLDPSFGIAQKEIEGFRVERMESAYPVLLKSYEERQRSLRSDIGINNLFLAGRTGLFKYYMLEESYDSGLEAAGMIKSKSLG